MTVDLALSAFFVLAGGWIAIFPERLAAFGKNSREPLGWRSLPTSAGPGSFVSSRRIPA